MKARTITVLAVVLAVVAVGHSFMTEARVIHGYHGICNGGVGQPYQDFIHKLRLIAESGDTNRLEIVLRRADDHSRAIYEVWLDDHSHDAYRKSIDEILK